MSDSGFIKIYRSMEKREWSTDPNMVALFLHLMINANFKRTKFKGRILEKGQLIFGRKAWSEKTGISEQSLRTCLNNLKSTGEITIETTRKYSVVTLTNWVKYQSQPNEPTSNQPAINQQSTNQPTKQSTNQPTKQSTKQSTSKYSVVTPTNWGKYQSQPNEPTNQPTKQSTSQPTKQSTKQSTTPEEGNNKNKLLLPSLRSDNNNFQKDFPDQNFSKNPPPTPAPKNRQGTRLPEHWKLEDAGWDYALDQGLTAEEVRREEDNFRDYWIAKSGQNANKCDWDATWRGWVRRSIEFKQKGSQNGRNYTDRQTESVIDRQLKELREAGWYDDASGADRPATGGGDQGQVIALDGRPLSR